jgi:molybdopterin synthase sulfur carrier subunit
MPTVVISGSACRKYIGDRTEFDVKAGTFLRLVRELDEMFPGLGHQVEEGMAIAIDGEIYQDAYGASFGPDSEIVLFPKIAGG